MPGAISWADQSANGADRAGNVRAAAADPAAVAQLDQVWSSLADGRRQATVLFADIVASSHLVGGADPEDARDRLRAILELMEAQITRFGGTLCPTLGDGVMAVFGSPRAQEDHAIRACFAADAIVAEARRSALAEGPAIPRRSLPFNVRVGVASGEILWDGTGHRTGGRPAAVGEPVHLAAKLQQTAPINGIRLAGSTASQVPEWVEAEPAGTFDLSPQRRVALFEQKGVFQVRRAVVEATPFVGRERLVAQLGTAIAALTAGRGSAHLIQGDAGMGKTRLVRHVLEKAGRLRVLHWGQQQVRAVGTPEPMAQILADLLGDAALEFRAALESALAGFEGLSPAAAMALADTMFPTVAGDAGIPAATRLRSAAEAVVHLALRKARRQPLLVVIEDLHWAGSEITAVVERLAARATEGRVLLLATSRRLPEASSLNETTKIHKLYPLPESAAAALFRHAVADNPQIAAAGPSLIDRAHGNPFYLIQYVQALLDNPGCADNPDALQGLPPTVQGLLAARIDGLGDAERGVLWAASVVGQTVDVELLSVLLNSDAATALASLSRLADLGFLDKTRILPRVEFTFRHALIHEAAYTTLTRRDRRRLHGKLAEALLREWANDLPGRDESVARHAQAGELWELALDYGWRAGRDARQRGCAPEAMTLFSTACEALQQLEKHGRPPVTSVAIDLRLDKMRAAMPVGRHGDLAADGTAALALARHSRDHRREALVLSVQSSFESVFGHLPQAAALGEEALAIAPADDDAVRYEALVRVGILYVDMGDYRRAEQRILDAEAIYTMAGPACSRGLTILGPVFTRAGLARCRAEFGNKQEALALVREAIKLADAAEHGFSRMYAYAQLGIVSAVVGDYAGCLGAMEQCVDQGFATGSTLFGAVAHGGIGYAQVFLGERAAGCEMLRAAVQELDRSGMTSDALLVRNWLALALVETGRAQEAAELAERNAEQADLAGARGLQAWALHAVARAQRASGQSLRADGALQCCLTLARENGMLALMGLCNADVAGDAIRVS